jgi:hypothetical protein
MKITRQLRLDAPAADGTPYRYPYHASFPTR